MRVNCEKEAVNQMALEILAAARTAPKAKGFDNIVTYLLEEEDVEKVATAMENLAEKLGAFLIRDAENIRNSDAVIMIGLKETRPIGLNCGACGFETCADFKNAEKTKETPFNGPICSVKSVDLGIALGSAAAKAKDMCLDNRIMYSAGAAACKTGMIDAECAYAIPLSMSGKSIYFDRAEMAAAKQMKK
ncbi:ferredoxin domain-containing protein [Methanimicrococcus blatticola]|uniref:Putative ferredoxin-like protein n=1 Tax=Methanimicrococcus blatticola TaxID=91560 RepID=A0A484F5F6_9EURY|nr:DUF2148 domain-containing protein [Methanimicrococcus blatticola]MBZ3935556.1 hypothetical protein [Methanimicrococcus blatticola]MCC2509199.1 DUF2148 domain-containing protein [Methanimicrococcus blatticola]TDQ69435.1 putative ferredoxin-like protein [Methanimicrococcus blatticola]